MAARRHDDHQQCFDHAHAAVAIAVAMAPAKEHSKLRQHGNGAGYRRRDRHQKRVMILDVGKLMRNDARNFVTREHVEQPGGNRDRGILRVRLRMRSAAGCP
jgi:hypothetical protein